MQLITHTVVRALLSTAETKLSYGSSFVSSDISIPPSLLGEIIEKRRKRGGIAAMINRFLIQEEGEQSFLPPPARGEIFPVTFLAKKMEHKKSRPADIIVNSH